MRVQDQLEEELEGDQRFFLSFSAGGNTQAGSESLSEPHKPYKGNPAQENGRNSMCKYYKGDGVRCTVGILR